MEIEVFLQAISAVGFPIVCAGVMGVFFWKTTQQQREDANKREERVFQSLDKFSNSLEAFNITLKSIDSRLEVVEEKLNK